MYEGKKAGDMEINLQFKYYFCIQRVLCRLRNAQKNNAADNQFVIDYYHGLLTNAYFLQITLFCNFMLRIYENIVVVNKLKK